MTWKERLRLGLPLLPIQGGTDGTIGLDEPGTIDKLLDTEELTVGVNTVQRERIQIAGASALDVAPVTAANGLDVDVTRVPAPLSVVGSGTEATAMRVTVATDSTGVLSVDDNGSSLTVDNAQLSVVGSGTEATAMRVTIATDSTGVLSVDDNGGALTVDGTVTANAGTNLNTSALALESGGNLAAAATSLAIIDNMVFGAGTEAAAQRVTIATDSTGVLSVDDNGGALTVDNGGTFAVQATAVGTVADDTGSTGAPVMVGGFAISPDGTDPGSVSAEADAARFRTDLNRRLLVNTRHPFTGHFHSNGSTALTDEGVVADPGDGFQVVITNVTFSSGHATAMNIFLEEGSTTILGPWYLEAVAGRGMHWTGHKQCTASTAVTVTTSASQAHSVDIDYFIQAV